MKTTAIILASGEGSRFSAYGSKQLAMLNGKAVFIQTIKKFEENPYIDEIILVINPNYRQDFECALKTESFQTGLTIVDGGSTRQLSSFNGLRKCDDQSKVLIHDGARPFVDDTIITNAINALDKYPSISVVIDSVDTVYELNDQNEIVSIPSRTKIKRVQTPQGFSFDIIKKAHELAKKDGRTDFTDDCSMVFHYKLAEIYCVEGDESNKKITYSDDLFE